jgi:hypothetical protein
MLDRRAGVSQVEDAAKRAQIENQRKEQEAAASAKAQAAAEKAQAEAERAAERERKDAEKAIAEQTRNVAGLAPVLPGTVSPGDIPGLGSSQAVRGKQGQVNEAASALNQFRERAASDNRITPEEIEGMFALMDEFVQLARSLGQSQKQGLSQIERLRTELTELKEAQRNMP